MPATLSTTRRTNGRRASQLFSPANRAASGLSLWTFFTSRWPSGRARFA